MRYSLGLAILVMGLTVQADDSEAKYTSKEGNFAVQFPAGADIAIMERKVSHGTGVKMTATRLDTKTYAVGHINLTAEALKMSPESAIDIIDHSFVTLGGLTKVSEKGLVIEKGKFPAREVVVEQGGKFVRTLIVMAPPRMYMVAVGGAKDFVTGEEGTEFLKSFEVLPPAKLNK